MTILHSCQLELSVILDILPNYIKRLFKNGRTASVSDGQEEYIRVGWDFGPDNFFKILPYLIFGILIGLSLGFLV